MKQTKIDYEDGAAAPREAKKYKPFVPGPNPDLPQFIAEHSTPYDAAADRYDVPAFDRDLVVDKAQPPKAIYDMHMYWSKKHWAAIREYIRHYLPKEYYPHGTGLVLDCFAGSGMTGVASIMEDRPCLLIDASPAAAFLSHCLTHPVDPEDLKDAYERMSTEPYVERLQKQLRDATGHDIRTLQQELEWLYETRCDRCGGPATTEYVVYSERFQCPNCNRVVALYDCPELVEPRRGRYCPRCVQKNHGGGNQDYLISTRTNRFGSVPVLVSYKCLRKCKPKREKRPPSKQDLRKIEEIEKTEIPHWVPERRMMDVQDDNRPWGVKWRAGTSNFRRVADLYIRRNLWALAAWSEARRTFCPDTEWLDIALSVSSLTCSRMLTEQKRAITKGTYYIPQIGRCIKPSNALDYSLKGLVKVQLALASARSHGIAALVSNAPAADMMIPACSLDYAFIDPPYLEKIQYGELNFVWDAWLRFDGSWLKDEIVVNPFRNKLVSDWDGAMRKVLQSIYHALKPARWLSICYHDTEPETWVLVQNMLLDSGFQISSVHVLDPKQKSSNQITGDKVVKSDLVLNCRKPRPSELRTDGPGGETELVSGRVREIVLDVLSHTGGQSRDTLWDTVLKRLLTRGQMAEHRFDEILAEVAFKSESGRWFLNERFENLSQSDIRNEEEAGAALEHFAELRLIGAPAQFAAQIALQNPTLAGRDEAEIELFIRENLIDDSAAVRKFRLGGRLKGIEFYDCLFFYLTRFLKGRPSGKSPRRNLAEFVEEYLVRFKDGDRWLYRSPDRAEAASLRKSRQTGLGRRIRQYVAFLKGEGEFPKEKTPDARTLVAWLKHCSAFGLADEGVALYERGGLMAQLHSLSEDERYDADEYYTNCKRKAAKTRDEEDEEGIAVEDDEADGEEEV